MVIATVSLNLTGCRHFFIAFDITDNIFLVSDVTVTVFPISVYICGGSVDSLSRL